jgi:hypothetical protein
MRANTRAEVVVLVEGHSDVAALEVLAEAHGVRDRLDLVAMGGVTNIRRHLAALAAERPDAVVLGVCDAGERRYLEHADGLAGVFVCDRDLEDELIRAIGVDGLLALIESEGELRSFELLQGQPAQRERTTIQQLHRFIGSKSGRKERYGRRLAQVVALDRVPAPLDALLRWAA